MGPTSLSSELLLSFPVVVLHKMSISKWNTNETEVDWFSTRTMHLLLMSVRTTVLAAAPSSASAVSSASRASQLSISASSLEEFSLGGSICGGDADHYLLPSSGYVISCCWKIQQFLIFSNKIGFPLWIYILPVRKQLDSSNNFLSIEESLRHFAFGYSSYLLMMTEDSKTKLL